MTRDAAGVSRHQSRRVVLLLSSFWLLWGIGVTCQATGAGAVGSVTLLLGLACLFIVFAHIFAAASGQDGMRWGFLGVGSRRLGVQAAMYRSLLRPTWWASMIRRTGWPLGLVVTGWAVLLCADLGVFFALLPTHTAHHTTR